MYGSLKFTYFFVVVVVSERGKNLSITLSVATGL